jgi:hypothetical protein
MTYYIHNIPGRLRIKSPVVKHDTDAATEMVRLLEASIGVRSVSVSAITGSCLIHYDPAMTGPDALVLVLSRRGFFDPSMAITNDDYIRNGATKLFSFLAASVLGAL